MIPEDFDPFKLASVGLADRRELPREPGVYFVISSAEELLYVGKAGNLRTRLMGHNRAAAFVEAGAARISYCIVTPRALDTLNLDLLTLEREAIRRFDPILNIHRPSLSTKNDRLPSVTAGTKLPVELYDEIARMAEEEERTFGYVMRRLILKGLESERLERADDDDSLDNV